MVLIYYTRWEQWVLYNNPNITCARTHTHAHTLDSGEAQLKKKKDGLAIGPHTKISITNI